MRLFHRSRRLQPPNGGNGRAPSPAASRLVRRLSPDLSASSLRAYDSGGKLLATYPATIGSSTFPSPSGTMEVRAIAPEPTYHFDPSGRDWGPNRTLTIAAGPNNPVGSAWINLTKEGYGIHGTPEPRKIGKDLEPRLRQADELGCRGTRARGKPRNARGIRLIAAPAVEGRAGRDHDPLEMNGIFRQ